MSQSKVRPLAFLAVLALGLVLVSAVVAVDTEAARGAGGRGGGGTARLVVTPDPVMVGSPSIVISGSGFGSGESLEVGVMGMTPSSFVTADGNGNFSTTYSPWSGFRMEGTGTAVALKNKGNTLVTRASTTFSVCSTDPCQP